MKKRPHRSNFSVITVGCRVNQYESRALADTLSRLGWRETHEDYARTVILNLCAVTVRASRTSRRLVYKYSGDPCGRNVYVMGCMTAEDMAYLRNLPRVRAVVPPTAREDIVELIAGKREELRLNSFGDRSRACVKVQDGCNRFCTYCIVPYLRGRSRSRPADRIVREVNTLLRDGIAEIWLVGTNLSDWEGGRLVELLKLLAPLFRGQARLRLTTLGLGSLDKELLELLKDEPGVCRHLHLSLQSGSERIRSVMGRRTPPGEILRRVRLFRRELPGIAFTGDVIAGFPGETEEDFCATCKVAREIGFSKLHIFPFSPRPGTKASRLGGRVPPAVVKRRVKRLNELERELFRRNAARLVGSRLKVVVEKAEGANAEGMAEEYVRVRFPPYGCSKGEIREVKAKSFENSVLWGEVAENG